MSWRDAPLYVEAFDLSLWVSERTGAWSHGPMARLTTEAACELLTAVSLALTFPARRAVDLERADAGIVRLRMQLRLAEHLGLISAGGLRHAATRLGAIGRMVGGWRKRLDRGDRRRSGKPTNTRGDEPPAARRA